MSVVGTKAEGGPKTVKMQGCRRLVRRGRRGHRGGGFTAVELIIVLVIVMTLAAMAIPSIVRAREVSRVAQAVGDIRSLEFRIEMYASDKGVYPNTLADLGADIPNDPWGYPYQFLNFATTNGKGSWRKDRFLVPLNTYYDLYSMGPDGASMPPLTAKTSHDDIVRANDGAFVGVAEQY